MYVDSSTVRSKSGKTYTRHLLRTSYRENGKVKHRLIANLSHCSPEEIEALRLALRHKGDVAVFGSIDELKIEQGLSVGAVFALSVLAKRCGLEGALGRDQAGKLALWQVLARLIEQGSRLSAVRLAGTHAAAEVLGLGGFCEDDLYKNLAWLAEKQAEIEKKLFRRRYPKGAEPRLFLYDVTSSYLEGECNALGAYGYDRDKKRGKLQIVLGMLCDQAGEPVSLEVFAGNTQDSKTFAAQVRKVAERFGAKEVTFVGDRGMIKSGGIEALEKAGFYYITAVTKPQIEKLVAAGVVQMSFFDEKLLEVEKDGIRYLLRRNPERAAELAASRAAKLHSLEQLTQKLSRYLSEHLRASVAVARRRLETKIEQLNASAYAQVAENGRTLSLVVDEAALAEAGRLDGCYVIKSNLPKAAADAETIHQRYKDLAAVERGFRKMKTAHLEVRPVFVRKEASTRGHAFVVMLAYILRRRLEEASRPFDITAQEGIAELARHCALKVTLRGATYQRIPDPSPLAAKLLEALDVKLPPALPYRNVNVATRKKLQSERV